MTRLEKNQKETVKNPAWLCQQVFYGRPLYGSEVEAIISFALDNMMDFEDLEKDGWKKLFERVVSKKQAHYLSQFQPDYSDAPRYA